MQEQIHNEISEQSQNKIISEKTIYNTFLKISRSQSGLPYKLRKQWHGFENTEYYPQVLRLKNFFIRNSAIDMVEFFKAPYTIYPGESGFDLAFYSSQKAIKIYTLAQKKKLLLPPDDPHHLLSIVNGLKFIQKFCDLKRIPLDDYPLHKEGIQNSFVVHLKERRISIYNMFVFDNFETAFQTNDPDLLRFTIPEIYDQISVFRTKFLNSDKAKKLAIYGFNKIKKSS